MGCGSQTAVLKKYPQAMDMWQRDSFSFREALSPLFSNKTDDEPYRNDHSLRRKNKDNENKQQWYINGPQQYDTGPQEAIGFHQNSAADFLFLISSSHCFIYKCCYCEMRIAGITTLSSNKWDWWALTLLYGIKVKIAISVQKCLLKKRKKWLFLSGLCCT